MAQFLCLALAIILFAGCPGNQFRLGVWAVFITNVLEVPALRFEPGGTTSEPNPIPAPANSAFTGVVTWQRNGSTVTFDHIVDGGLTYQYVGELSSSTAMAGTWQQTAGGNSSGTFTAQWIDN